MDNDVPTEAGTRRDMNPVLQLAVVIHRRAGVNDRRDPEPCIDIDDRPSKDDAACADWNVAAHRCARMNDSRHRRAGLLEPALPLKPGPIVTDRDKNAGKRFHLFQKLDARAIDLPTRNGRPRRNAIVKQDDFAPARRLGAVSCNLSMPSSAKNCQTTCDC